jgi:hypothetical protein
MDMKVHAKLQEWLATYRCSKTNPIIVSEAFPLYIRAHNHGQNGVDSRHERSYP